MKKLVGVFLVISLMALAPLHLSNAYLRSSAFDLVVVKPEESVWSIAARYTRDSDKTASLAEAIREVNGLDEQAAIQAGQELKVPVIGQQVQAQVAEK